MMRLSQFVGKNNITIEELLANAQRRKSSIGKEQGQDDKNKAKEKENFNENKEN